MKGGDQVDMLEFASYRDIDPSKTPVVALGCGHFFTAETLDGKTQPWQKSPLILPLRL